MITPVKRCLDFQHMFLDASDYQSLSTLKMLYLPMISTKCLIIQLTFSDPKISGLINFICR